jgi:hypothetical protein
MICGAAVFWHEHEKEKAAERKLAEAAQDCLARAERGDAKAQYNLARMYYRGQGVPQDYAAAARWSRKAADQGDAKAQYSLAYMYHQGQGVPLDYAEAVRWTRKAADQGLAAAQYGLGNCYREGQGVQMDHAEAVRWYSKAADQGLAVAQYDLGNSYRKGQGVAKDPTEAVRWYRRAEAQGDASARDALRIMSRGGQGRPMAHLTSIGVVLLALVILVVPQRRWGRVAWLPWALCSALCAALVIHELRLSASSLALLERGPLGPLWRRFGHGFLIAFFGCGSAISAAAAVRAALCGQKVGAGK